MAPTAAMLQPIYERSLRQRLVDAHIRNGYSPEDAHRLAQTVMEVLAGEVDHAMAWGVGCTSCAYYLEQILEGYTAAERAGVELLAGQLDRFIEDARTWIGEGLALEHVETGVRGFLVHYHAHLAGRTFQTPTPETATPTLSDR